MNKINTLLLAVAGILLSACEKEIEFKGEYTDPLLVVNSVLTPDSTVKVHLSKSRFFLDNKSNFDYVTNATVELIINGISTTLQHDVDGFYRTAYTPRIGDSISLKINAPGHLEVTSNTVIQAKSNVLSIDTLSRKEADRYASHTINDTVVAYSIYYENEYGIRLKDPEDIKNFYRLSILREVWNTEDSTLMYAYPIYFSLTGVSQDAGSGGFLGLFDEGNSDEYHVFSDELFNGKEIVLRFSYSEYELEIVPGYEYYFNEKYYRNTEILTINFQTVSNDFHLYLRSKKAAEGIFETIFTEPVQVYSNIKNGIGILGSMTNHYIKTK